MVEHGHGRRGAARSRTYRIWDAMNQRCHNPRSASYAYYGARGIAVCDRWRNFKAFFQDMGECPAGMTIDREDNDRGYGPGNCRWVPMGLQSRNRRSNNVLEHEGRRQCLTDWAREIGMSAPALRSRLKKGMSVSEALTKPATDRWGNPFHA